MAQADVRAAIEMTPEMIAQAWWSLDSDDQAKFFAALWRIADYKLCLQTAWIVNAISEMADRGDHDAMNAFRTLADHADSYPEAAAEWRALGHQSVIRRMTASAQQGAQPE